MSTGCSLSATHTICRTTRTTVVTATGPVVQSFTLGPKSSIARYSKWGSWPYPYIAGIAGCPCRSWSILLSYRRIVRLTLCDTRDFLSATVRPEFASTAWKTRACGWQWWHQWNIKTETSKDDSHMHQSRELGRGGRSGLGTWRLLEEGSEKHHDSCTGLGLRLRTWLCMQVP